MINDRITVIYLLTDKKCIETPRVCQTLGVFLRGFDKIKKPLDNLDI